jgi:hypothetical protein
MSCHDIGRGMAAVGRVVLDLYDEGCYDLETAKKLLQATINGVNWCDGNYYEAEESLAGRCSVCLKKSNSPETELVFGNRYSAKISGVSDAEENEFVSKLYCDRKILTDILCRDCYEQLSKNFD